MDVSSYFRSLSLEMTALKDRIRYLSDEPHWQTDGQWKESVLRSILRRHLPKSASVGTGFVVAPKGATRQIDVLVYDATKPVLFSDGDLVFVASDAVLAIIEVKSRIHDSGQLTKALQILADNTEFIYAQTPGAQFLAQPPFVGLFAYEWYGTEANASAVLDALKAAALPGGDHNPHTRIVNHVALGPSFFIRYWEREPSKNRGPNYCRWHAYELQDRTFGYFIHNIVDSISSQAVSMNPELWFPNEGKEIHMITSKGLHG